MNEDLTNELIEVIWPYLDNGMRPSEIRAAFHNVLDSWELPPRNRRRLKNRKSQIKNRK